MPNNSVLDDFDAATASTTQGDPAVWTLLGEAGNDPQGQLAVASTIANRAKLLKTEYGQIVTDPMQGYEAWQNSDARAKTQKNYPVGSDQYNQAAQLLSDLKSGKSQPLPYDSFYSPSGQSQLKRPPPAFEDGKSGVDIGGNRFFTAHNKAGSVLDEFDNLTPGSDPGVTDAVSGVPVPDVQAKAARDLQKSGDLIMDPKKGALYKGMPFYQTQGDNQPEHPGDYWMDKTGAVHQVPTDYNGAVNLGNAALLGHGNQLMAGVQALKATGGNFTNPMFGNFYQQALAHYNQNQQSYSQQHPIASGVQQLAGNLATVVPTMAAGGEFLAPVKAAIGPVGEFLAGGSTGINPLATAASRAASGAIQGGVAAGLTAGQSSTPFVQQVGQGAAIGGALGPVVGAGGDLVKNLFNGGSTEGVTQNVANLAKTAIDKYGIPLRIGQIQGVGDRSAAVSDSNLIGSHAATAANNASQKTAFTQAVAKTFGSDADQLTPDVMQEAKDRIGGVMNEIASRTNITDTDPLLTKLSAIAHEASSVVPDPELKPILKQIQNIGDTIRSGGGLSGDSYAALIAKNSALDRAANGSNSNIRTYAQDIRNALDDSAEAHMAPGDKDSWDQARLQYKNMMSIKNLASKANVEGEIQPSLLAGAVNTNFKNNAFQGAGDLGELSLIGKTFLKEPPNSFTADRLSDRLMKYAPGILGGAGLADFGLALKDPILAGKLAGTALAGAAVKGSISAAKNASNLSPSIRNKFLANALKGGGIPPVNPYNPTIPASVLLTKNLFDQQKDQ